MQVVRAGPSTSGPDSVTLAVLHEPSVVQVIFMVLPTWRMPPASSTSKAIS